MAARGLLAIRFCSGWRVQIAQDRRRFTQFLKKMLVDGLGKEHDGFLLSLIIVNFIIFV